MNGWCSVKPAWLLLIEHILGEDGDRQVSAGVEPPTSLRSLVSGDRGLANPSAVMARLTPPEHRRAMVLGAVDTSPRDRHSEFALTYLIRNALSTADTANVDDVLQSFLDEALPPGSIAMTSVAAAKVATYDISPVAVPLGDEHSMLYHDRRSGFLLDPDYSVMCGLATTSGLANLGEVAARSAYVTESIERGRRIGLRFAGGLAIDPGEAGYESLGGDDWALAVGFRATSLLLLSPRRQLSVAYTCPLGFDRLSDKSELLRRILDLVMVKG